MALHATGNAHTWPYKIACQHMPAIVATQFHEQLYIIVVTCLTFDTRNFLHRLMPVALLVLHSQLQRP